MTRAILLVAFCLSGSLFGQQTASDIIPANEGQNLGSWNQRWNGYFDNVWVFGQIYGQFGATSFPSNATFSGNDLFSGTNSFTNANSFSAATNLSGGGSLAGTFTGNSTWSGNLTFSGSNTHSGTNTFTNSLFCHNSGNVRCVDAANKAGWSGTTADAWLTAAQTDIGANPGTIQIAPGSYTFAASFTPNSNIKVIGAGTGITIITAASALNAAMFSLSSVSNVQLQGFTLDGDCARSGTSCTGNTNANNLVTFASVSNSLVDRVEVRNSGGNGFVIGAGNSNLAIKNSKADGLGQALPSQTGAGFFVGPGSGSGNSHLLFDGDVSYNNNSGFFIEPSSTASSEDIAIVDSAAYSNANDGVGFYGPNASQGALRGIRVAASESFCNGWPANGVGFSSNCVAGPLQTGATGSSSGLGFDFNAATLTQFTAVGNRAHDNYFDGFAASAWSFTTVNTQNAASGSCTSNCVIYVSGDPFNKAWKAGEGIRVPIATEYILSAVQGATSTLSLTTAPGTQTGVVLSGPGRMAGTFVGNLSYNNRDGFYSQMADGITYSGNSSWNNGSWGFATDDGSFNSYNGDMAWNNGQGGSQQIGFLTSFSTANSYFGIGADDNQAVATQLFGVYIDGVSSNVVVTSNHIYTGTPVQDLGTGDHYDNGATVTGVKVSGGSISVVGTGACATITTTAGGKQAGTFKCTGTTGASTVTASPGTAPNGWTCYVQDLTTRANLLEQTSTGATSCVLTATSVTSGDVFTFMASAY